MKFKMDVEVRKKTSKLGNIYYALYIEELDKFFILSGSEAKLLSLLHQNDKVNVVENLSINGVE